MILMLLLASGFTFMSTCSTLLVKNYLTLRVLKGLLNQHDSERAPFHLNSLEFFSTKPVCEQLCNKSEWKCFLFKKFFQDQFIVDHRSVKTKKVEKAKKMEEFDRISPVFKDREIFITGVTGFLGKVFVEKLMRETKVAKIYALIRVKKGFDSKERLRKIFEDPLFDTLKTQMSTPEILKKFIVIDGDCSKLRAAISDKDRKTITENVSCIFHLSANVRFDESLKAAVETNTRGTREIINLALECKKLDMFMHVSTCYCHLKEKVLYDKSYAAPKNPHEIIELVEGLSIEEAEKYRDEALDFYPNTYAFSKALAEGLVNEARDEKNLKALLIRPSIIIPTVRDPIEGWTDNLNGFTGMMVAYGRGALRSVHCNEKITAGDFMPVDLCVAGLIICTWNYIENNDKERNVVNFATSKTIGSYTFKEVLEMGQKFVKREVPFNYLLWYPNIQLTSSTLIHKVRAFFKHWIPALLIDALLSCFGFKPIMMHVHRRLAKGLDVFDYYSNNNWEFMNTNMIAIVALMNETELNKYYFDIHRFDRKRVEKLIGDSIRGAKKYILKETDETLPLARKRMKIMYVLDLTVTALIYGFAAFFLFKFFMPYINLIKAE